MGAGGGAGQSGAVGAAEGRGAGERGAVGPAERRGAGESAGQIAGWLVFAAVFALYALAASPALGWLDSPEMVAASVGLGVPHSPGQPLAVMAGAAPALVPLGDLTLRVNLAAALAGAAAALALVALGRAALARAVPALAAGPRAVVAAGTALVLAGSWAAWSQSVRAEVYALVTALLLGAAALVVAWDRDRGAGRLVAAGLLGGLALATHHLIALTVLVPLMGFVLIRRRVAGRPGAALAGVTALAGVVGLAAFLYLPVRSAAGPALDWGAPHRAAGFAWTVSGAMFARNLGGGHVSPFGQDLAEAVFATGQATGWPLALLGLLGAVGLLLRPGARRLAAVLLGVVAAGVVARALLGFDPETPDHHGYLLPAAAALAALAALGVGMTAAAIGQAAARGPGGGGAGGGARAAARGPGGGGAAGGGAGGGGEGGGGGARAVGRIAVAAGALMVALAAVRAARVWPEAAVPTQVASDELARAELEDLPPRALLITSYFQTEFRLLGLRAVEQTRPDVSLLQRGLLSLPGGREAAAGRAPALARLIRAPLGADAPTPVAALARIARTRPVFFELDPDLDPPVLPHLVSVGRFARFLPAPPGPEARAAAEAAEAARDRTGVAHTDGDSPVTLAGLAARAGPADRADLQAAALWLDLSRLHLSCALGRRAAAQEALRRAWDLFPGDVMLRSQARRCGLSGPLAPTTDSSLSTSTSAPTSTHSTSTSTPTLDPDPDPPVTPWWNLPFALLVGLALWSRVGRAEPLAALCEPVLSFFGVGGVSIKRAMTDLFGLAGVAGLLFVAWADRLAVTLDGWVLLDALVSALGLGLLYAWSLARLAPAEDDGGQAPVLAGAAGPREMSMLEVGELPQRGPSGSPPSGQL